MKLNPHTVNADPDEPVILSPSTEGKQVEPPRRLSTPSSALNEFRVALDVWFPLMDERTKAEAIQMAEDWRPPPSRKRG